MDEVEFHAPPRESKNKRWLSFHPFSGYNIYNIINNNMNININIIINNNMYIYIDINNYIKNYINININNSINSSCSCCY